MSEEVSKRHDDQVDGHMRENGIPSCSFADAKESADRWFEEIEVNERVNECSAAVLDGVKFWALIHVFKRFCRDRTKNIWKMNQGARGACDAVKIIESAQMPSPPFSSPHAKTGEGREGKEEEIAQDKEQGR